MKRIIKVIVVILIVLILLFLLKDVAGRMILSSGVKALTGLKLDIKGMAVGIFNTTVDVKDLKIFNPSGYTDNLMADVPEIYIDYDLGALFKRKVHLEHLKLDLKRLIVVKNEEGELNLNSLKVVKTEKQDIPPQEEKEEAKESRFQIDVLDLKIGKVIYKDYSKGAPPVVKEYNVNIDERYENITEPTKLAKLILVRALVHTTISKLTQFDLSPLEEGLATTFEKITETTTETATKTLEAGIEQGEKVIEGATEKIKELFPIKE